MIQCLKILLLLFCGVYTHVVHQYTELISTQHFQQILENLISIKTNYNLKTVIWLGFCCCVLNLHSVVCRKKKISEYTQLLNATKKERSICRIIVLSGKVLNFKSKYKYKNLILLCSSLCWSSQDRQDVKSKSSCRFMMKQFERTRRIFLVKT